MSPVPGTEQIFITGGHKSTWFLTGNRDLNTATASPERIEDLLQIYPNPVEQFLEIEAPEREGAVVLHLYDVQGRLLQAGEYSGNISTPISLNVSHLNPGVYSLRLIGEDRQYAGRFVKK